MADAIAAYKTAFSSFKKNALDYVVYSILAFVLSVVLCVIVAMAFIVFGIVSIGAFVGLASDGNLLTPGALGTMAMLLLLFGGLIIFMLVQCGLMGAYLETIGAFLSGRKQTFGGFFSAIFRHAGSIFVAFVLASIVSSIPLLAALAGAMVLGFSSLPGIALLILGVFLTYAVSMLFTFAPLAIAVENRGAVDGLRSSVAHVLHSPLGFIIFLLILAALSIPSFVVIYVPLFLMPLGYAALLAFYKQ